MRIKKIISQNRRDFTAVYECENCGHTYEGPGYDDAYFHMEVIPKKTCDECKKVSPDNYSPCTTKYPAGMRV